jgi:hypothetical protein
MFVFMSVGAVRLELNISFTAAWDAVTTKLLRRKNSMAFARTIKRNQMKRNNGNNRIRKVWRQSQIRAYGFKRWWNLYVNCDPKRRRALTLIVSMKGVS